MYRVYQAINPIDAHLVKHALEAEGIPAFVLGEALMGGAGELLAGGFIEVRVPEAFAEAAALVLAEWEIKEEALAQVEEAIAQEGLSA
ncbi:hypothetical protein CO613_03575 [Lysobacteraceae bacterium NML07-0707]|nr:hypothetical protein CO613_03575 [Xanthomonadaceae bacterium NML07-0707]